MAGDDGQDRGSMFDMCTEVSPMCPVEATVLGYAPNLGSGYFFTIAFGALTIASLGLGIWKRTWTFAAALTLGLLLETLGYVGRILLNDNPWDQDAFQLQICTIILGPTLICAAIYLTLKHVALALNPSLSRLEPKWYPRIFLPADLSCLIVQAIGGGIAAAAGKDDQKLLDGGNNAIIAGVCLQVVVLAVFGGLGLDYWLRVRKYMSSGTADAESEAVWRSGKFRAFGCAIAGAFLAVFTRCIYRIAEMAGGWGNHIMQHEESFLVLDPTLILIATGLLTIFHPGIFFPQMRNGYRKHQTSPEVAEVGKDTPGETTAESGNEGVKVGGSP